jgi:cholestenol Delta-isomerase
MSPSVTTPPLHPYYPEGVPLSGSAFVRNAWDVSHLISAFGAGWAVILGVTLIVVRKVNPRLKASDQALVLWFVLSESSQS